MCCCVLLLFGCGVCCYSVDFAIVCLFSLCVVVDLSLFGVLFGVVCCCTCVVVLVLCLRLFGMIWCVWLLLRCRCRSLLIVVCRLSLSLVGVRVCCACCCLLFVVVVCCLGVVVCCCLRFVVVVCCRSVCCGVLLVVVGWCQLLWFCVVACSYCLLFLVRVGCDLFFVGCC